MSVNYAAGLSEYPNKGKCGLPEFMDAKEDLEHKITELVKLVQQSTHLVVLTGAGISTSCGIPDFRGPKGVWTLEEKGVTPTFSTTFDSAKFSIGHLALVALEEKGFLKHLVTQNVDGLHLRSGFPRNRLSILHGDMFVEECDKCRHQYIRRNSVQTMGLKLTGKKCDKVTKRGISCRGKLRDTILDWEDSLPNDDLDNADRHARMADVFLVLGSSLQILPAGNLPLLSRKNGGKFVSVNFQRTKYHKKTDLIINASIDDVMQKLCDRLGVVIPSYDTPRVRLHSVNTEVGSCPLLNFTCDKEMLVCGTGEESTIFSDIKPEITECIDLKRKVDDNSTTVEECKLRIMEVKS